MEQQQIFLQALFCTFWYYCWMGKPRGNSPALQEFHCSWGSCRHQWKLCALDPWKCGSWLFAARIYSFSWLKLKRHIWLYPILSVSVSPSVQDTYTPFNDFFGCEVLCLSQVDWSPHWRDGGVNPAWSIWCCPLAAHPSSILIHKHVQKSKWEIWLGKIGHVSKAHWVTDGTALPKQSIQKSWLFSESWWLLRCIKNFRLLITEESVNLRIEVPTRETAKRK